MASSEQIQNVIDAWKEADSAASAAERLVTEASIQYMQKNGARPPDDMIGDARMLRSLANQRLEKALQMMRQATSGRDS